MPISTDMKHAIEAIAARKGGSIDKKSLARMMSLIEGERDGSVELIKAAGRELGHAYRIGITGPPGAGKSTLTAALTETLARNARVGIIAIDPTSPFSGGAVLGDRFRMNEVAQHASVFIRSMASRGSSGGLAKTTHRIADLMDACRFDYVILETVGVGQAEIEIAEHADTTLVVLVPESGDGVQAMKAGLMEIADIYVVNKSDRDQADTIKREIENMLELREGTGHWKPPVVKTIATQKDGISALIEQLRAHRSALETSGDLEARRKRRIKRELQLFIEEKLERQWKRDQWQMVAERFIDKVWKGEISALEAAEILFDGGSGTA